MKTETLDRSQERVSTSALLAPASLESADAPHRELEWAERSGRRIEALAEGVTLILGDALDELHRINAVDAVLTDPPYSSGGQFRGDRTQKPSAKYVNTDSVITCRTEFAGDNRDQRAFLTWCAMWLRDCHAACKPGATLMVFTDWRQLPTITDAIQCGGWVWRNLVTWWKPGVRMQRGRFSASAEYVVYGSIGVPIEGEGSPQNVIQCAPVGGEDKEHIAEKPVQLVQELIRVTLPGATVLDPFMGSGTTGVACVRAGRRFIGIEKDPAHFEAAVRRIRAELAQGVLPLAGGGGAERQGEMTWTAEKGANDPSSATQEGNR